MFVDDEPNVLEGIENMFFDAPEDWGADFVTSGPAALEKLSEQNYDVLVTDMRMPGSHSMMTRIPLTKARHR